MNKNERMTAAQKAELQTRLKELYAQYRERKDNAAAIELIGFIECLTILGFAIEGYDENYKLITAPTIAS